MKDNEFQLVYRCTNNGDGSVSVHFHSTEEEAEALEEKEEEGWGESSVSYVRLKIQDGLLYIVKNEYTHKDGKCISKQVLIPVSLMK